jgi:hypothetical protein
MARKSKSLQEAFTGYESFIYLLTEIEIVVESGTVNWSAESAVAASRRLDKLAATVHELAVQIENE